MKVDRTMRLTSQIGRFQVLSTMYVGKATGLLGMFSWNQEEV